MILGADGGILPRPCNSPQDCCSPAGRKAPGAGFTLAADTRETGGGVVLQRGRMEINCGFAELLRRARQEDSPAVAAVLFD